MYLSPNTVMTSMTRTSNTFLMPSLVALVASPPPLPAPATFKATRSASGYCNQNGRKERAQ